MVRTITVEGMSCGHCEAAVEEALRGVAGVIDVSADHDVGRASVDGDAEVGALVRAVEDAGYTAHA
jgi:copper chaperone CopZ